MTTPENRSRRHADNHSADSLNQQLVAASEPTVLRVLSLDSEAPAISVLLLTVQNHLPPLDLAIFVETEQNRSKILSHLARIQQVAIKAGIPILRLSAHGSTVEAIRAKVWEILGRPSLVPDHVVAEVVFGVCLDDIHKATEPDVPYLRYVFPLLELGWSRRDCDGYLHSLQRDSSGAQRWRRGWAL